MRGAAAIDIKEEHLDEAHIVELLSNEYSLEEIIYQLARILFSQSLSQGIYHPLSKLNLAKSIHCIRINEAGHPEAEEALKKFADFLEKESKEGKMSPQLQKKVLGKLHKTVEMTYKLYYENYFRCPVDVALRLDG